MLAPNTPPSDADLVHRYNDLRAYKETREAEIEAGFSEEDLKMLHQYETMVPDISVVRWAINKLKTLSTGTKACAEGMEAIKGEMLRRLNERSPDVTRKANSKTEHGTAFRVRHVRARVVGRDAFLDFCLENWDAVGSDILDVSAVTSGFSDEKGAFYDWTAAHRDEQGNEVFPPGLEVERTVSVNIRKA